MTRPFEGFDDEVTRRIAEAGAPRPERSVVVLDFDNTCIRGDIGELFSYWLVDEMGYRYDLDAFWALVDERDGRTAIREMVTDLRTMEEGDPARDEVFTKYRSEMAAIYSRKLQREGKAAAYEWAVRLHVGLTPDEMHAHSAACVQHEWSSELFAERLETSRDERIDVEFGIRRFGPVRRAIEWLGEQGHEVWIVSATNIWTVRSAASIMFGIPPERVIGNRVKVRDERLTATLDPPALFRAGKVEVIERDIGVRPIIAFGDSETDLDMLSWAESLAVVIDHGEELIGRHAAEHGWAVQARDELELEEGRERSNPAGRF